MASVQPEVDLAVHLHTFSRFRSLPPELRLMVWEMTWPGARVIEPVYLHPPIEDQSLREPDDSPAEYTDDDSSSEPDDGPPEHTDDESSSGSDDNPPEYPTHRVHIILRPIYSLSTWRRTPVCDCILEVLERSPDPIALHVCRELRTYILRHYTCMQHYKLDNCAFYVHPGRDALWLTAHVTKNLNNLTGLRFSYGRQLGKIQRMFMDVHDWVSMDASIALCSLWAVHEIKILLDVDNDAPGKAKEKFGKAVDIV